jgi:hypothetical protein
MRERAEAATPGPWQIRHRNYIVTSSTPGSIIGCDEGVDAAHVASWHPAVALAVADWLDHVHANVSTYNARNHEHAFAVARAYLGEAS